MSRCTKLEALPSGINLKSLDRLDLGGCSRLKFFPDISSNISRLDLSRTMIEEFPSVLHLEKLKTLKMKEIKSQKLWEGAQSLTRLTMLDLSGSEKLQEVPDLSLAINMEWMNLGGCSSLLGLPSSSNQNLKKLAYLSMEDCTKLKIFPKISSSVYLLILNRTAIKEVPRWINTFYRLRCLRMKECKNLKYVPRFSSMQQLKEIDFSGCGDIQDNCFREKYGVSNMMATIELSKDPGFTVCKETEEDKDPGFTVCKETEEDHPYDGYSWREYCQIFANGNPNPRIYYKCTQNGCNAKKHVERGAYDVKILVTTYTGKHGHPKPATRSSSSSGQKNIRSSSSVPARLGRSPFSSSSTTQDMTLFPYPFVLVPQGMMPFSYPSASAPQFPSSLNPGVDMTHLYMSGLSTRPSFPVNQMIGIRKYTTERRREMEGKKEEMRRVWSLESKRRVTLEDLFSEKGFEVFE